MDSPPVQGYPILEPMNKKGKNAEAKKAFGKLAGKSGDVRVKAPASSAVGYRSLKPEILRTDERSTRICHKEQWKSLAGSDPFLATGDYINPGLPTVFPWLSTQTEGWEQYRFNRLSLHYIPRCGTSTNGIVFLAPDYDVYDPIPLMDVEVMSYYNAVQDAPWAEFRCDFDPASMFPNGKQKFIRGTIVPGGDLKTYDVCQMIVAMQDFDAAFAGSAGSLFWDYDVTLSVPQTHSRGVPSTPFRSVMLHTGATSGGPGATGAIWYPAWTASVGAPLDTMGLAIVGGTNIHLPAGWFRLAYAVATVNGTVGTVRSIAVIPYLNGAAFGASYTAGSGPVTFSAGQTTAISATGEEIFLAAEGDQLSLRVVSYYTAGTEQQSGSIVVLELLS